MERAIELGLIKKQDGERVWNIFKDWEVRYRKAREQKEQTDGVGKNGGGP